MLYTDTILLACAISFKLGDFDYEGQGVLKPVHLYQQTDGFWVIRYGDNLFFNLFGKTWQEGTGYAFKTKKRGFGLL